MTYRIYKYLVFCFIILLSSNCLAQDKNNIQIIGLQKVPANTVFNMLTDDVLDHNNPENIASTIRSIFASGYFRDVEVMYQKPILIIKLTEHPTITKIEIVGNSKIPTDSLLEALKKQGLHKGEILNTVTLNQIKSSLIQQYQQMGLYANQVKVNHILLEDENTINKAQIIIHIAEGETSKISDINFIGNTSFSKDELLEISLLQPEDTVGWLGSEDEFNMPALFTSIKNIQDFYHNNGYIKAAVTKYKIALNSDYKKIYLNISINEGNRYNIGTVNFDIQHTSPQSRSLIDLDILNTNLTITQGAVYQKKIIDSIKRDILKTLKTKHFYLATVNAKTDFIGNTVNVTFVIKPNKITYINRIIFRGNNKTKDSVLRREMRQFESAPADSDLIALSNYRLQRLPYVTNLQLNEQQSPTSDDSIDLIYSLQEQFTGTISANLSYSNLEKTSAGIQYSENNILGSGMTASLKLQIGSVSKVLSFSLLDPYFTTDNISMQYGLSQTSTDYDSADIGNFTTNTVSGNLMFGYPISENVRVNAGLYVKNVDLNIGTSPDQEIQNFVDAYGTSIKTYGINSSIVRDTLNNGLLPTAGNKQSLRIDINTPDSSLNTYKISSKMQHYLPIVKDRWLIRTHAELGYLNFYSNQDNKAMPIFDHFYAGGQGSIRGYSNNSLGPRYATQIDDNDITDVIENNSNTFIPGNYMGGNILLETGVELIFPHPWESRNIRTLFFIDIAQLYNNNCSESIYNTSCNNESDINYDSLNKTYGLAFIWISPMAPIQLSIARPIDEKPGDKIDTRIQFTLGYGL